MKRTAYTMVEPLVMVTLMGVTSTMVYKSLNLNVDTDGIYLSVFKNQVSDIRNGIEIYKVKTGRNLLNIEDLYSQRILKELPVIKEISNKKLVYNHKNAEIVLMLNNEIVNDKKRFMNICEGLDKTNGLSCDKSYHSIVASIFN